jgi:hypothetical protein
MKLKAQPRETIEVTLAEGCVATVARITRKETSDIFVRALRRTWDAEANDGKGGIVSDTDGQAILQERLRIGVPSVRGLTVDAVLSLAELPEGVELDVADPDENGCLAWDHDRIVYAETITIDDPSAKDPNRKKAIQRSYTLPMYLYTYGPVAGFGAQFEEVQREFARLKAEAEKKSSTTPKA